MKQSECVCVCVCIDGQRCGVSLWVCLEEMTERRQPQQKHKVRGNDSVNGNRENKRSGREIGGRKKRFVGNEMKKRKKTYKRKRKERLKNVWNAE